MPIKTLPFLLFIFFSNTGYSQNKELNYNIQSTFVGGTGNATAFWGVSNKFGTISVEPNSAMMRTGLFVPYDTTVRKRFDIAAGLDILNRFDGKYNLFFQQYYLKLKYKAFTLQGGRIEEIFGNQDSSLSSGGLLWSGNAPPMPKITVGILNYVPVPFTHGYLEVKGAMAHGWFGNTSHVKDEWLHHKYIYFRAGGDLPVKLSFGFHHFVQWGGVSPEYGRLPSSLKDFWIVFRAKQVDTTGIPQGNGGMISEYSNRIGNHLGARELGLDINFSRFDAGAYFQSYYEDASSIKWHNLPDGLYGMYIKPKNIKWLTKIVYEYISTTNQSEPYRSHTIYPGSDDLFNNGVYYSGWTYNQLTIGSAFITSPELLKKSNIPTNIQFDYLRNNKIQAFHVGVEGCISSLKYRLKLSNMLNYGTNYYPFTLKSSLSSFLEIKKILKHTKGVELSTQIVNDFGYMYKYKMSIIFSFRKNGVLF